MSTRGNYVFIDYPVKEENGDWVKDPQQIVDLKLGISDETPVIKHGNKIYVHFDNYPSHAIPALFEFLNLPGAKERSYDIEYLSAWFVAYQIVGLGGTFDNGRVFAGCGLENYLNGWCDFTYVILPDDGATFRIFIFDRKFNFIDEVHSTDDLKELEEEEWWY